MVSWNSKFNITVAFFELTFRYVWPVARMRRNTWTKNKQPFLPLLHDHSPGSRKHPNRVSSIGLRLFYWLGKERIKCLLGGFIFHPSVAIFIACHCVAWSKIAIFFYLLLLPTLPHRPPTLCRTDKEVNAKHSVTSFLHRLFLQLFCAPVLSVPGWTGPGLKLTPPAIVEWMTMQNK